MFHIKPLNVETNSISDIDDVLLKKIHGGECKRYPNDIETVLSIGIRNTPEASAFVQSIMNCESVNGFVTVADEGSNNNHITTRGGD